MSLRVLLALCLGLGLAAQAPRHVAVAAAADLKWALEEVRRDFAKDNPGIQVDVSFGSSGQFYAQLTQKAPFDLFLSADLDYARKLQEAGLGRSLFTYAVGRLALVVPTGSPLDLDKLGLHALLDPSVKHVAMANPGHAPYGRAAAAALAAAGLMAQVQPRLVLGENVSQAAQFVHTGAAEAGLVALSLAQAPEMSGRCRAWVVPRNLHPPLEQGGVILAWARDPGATETFRAFLAGPRGRAILARFGFEPPPR
jgi:molybdate transport system substrate-binding protein